MSLHILVANQKTASSGSGSGRSSTRKSTQLDTTEGIDLAYRISLTDRAEEQKEGLKRVPSTGGTSQLDLTVPDTEFFGLGKVKNLLIAIFADVCSYFQWKICNIILIMFTGVCL